MLSIHFGAPARSPRQQQGISVGALQVLDDLRAGNCTIDDVPAEVRRELKQRGFIDENGTVRR